MTTYAKLAYELVDVLETAGLVDSLGLAMLRDIRDGKLVCVPAEPTEAMLRAGGRAISINWQKQDTGQWSGDALLAYRAMLKAAGESP